MGKNEKIACLGILTWYFRIEILNVSDFFHSGTFDSFSCQNWGELLLTSSQIIVRGYEMLPLSPLEIPCTFFTLFVMV